MTIELGHLEELISEEKFQLLDISISLILSNYLDSLPWGVGSLDWTKMPAFRLIQRSENIDVKLAQVICSQSAFGKYPYAIAFFSPEAPCLAGRVHPILMNLDLIFWKTPGTQFVFAGDLRDSAIVPKEEVFMQYDGGDVLRCSR